MAGYRGETATPSARTADKLPDRHVPADDAGAPPSNPGNVRPEVVAKAEKLMTSGRLGADPESIADRIIDSLLKSRDPNS